MIRFSPMRRTGVRSTVSAAVIATAVVALTPACTDAPRVVSRPVDAAAPLLPVTVDAGLCTERHNVKPDLVPAQVLVVFDRSGSMGAAFGKGTRFSVAASILGEFLTFYDARMEF